MKKQTSLLLALSLCAGILSGCGQMQSGAPTANTEKWADAISIQLSDNGITVDGAAVPAEETATVYIANDIVYYEEGHDFTYGEGTEADAHSAAEAAAHTVVHITQPGSYVLSGTLSAGQIAVDLGDDAEEDPNAVVTLILNGVDITCTVAPAVIFYNVYECGGKDEDTATKDVDTSAAGANVLIADGTTNTVNGAYVARIYKPDSVVLSEDGTEVVDEKKLHKYDAAFYSKMSMNVDGETEGSGILNIHAENEGLDSELHLTINGGNINIISGNDGINTNEDYISVTTINDGVVTIQVSGETGEGDGIDSNGWLVINGGKVIAAACDNSADSGIDSDMGIHINGGTVIASGHMLDRIEDGGQNYAVFRFAGIQSGEEVLSLRNTDGEELMAYAPINPCSIVIFSSPELTAGDYTLWANETQLAASSGGQIGGMGGGFRSGNFGSQMPEDFDPARIPEGMERPEDGNRGERPGFKEMERNEDGTITMPEGAVVDPENGTITLPDGSTIQVDAMGRQPGGQGGGHGFGGTMGGQAGSTVSEIFAVTDGGTTFSNVMAASESESVMQGEGTETYPIIIGGDTEPVSENQA